MKMQFPIINRFNGTLIIRVEIECGADASHGTKLGLAVRAALSLYANLRSADLRSANLQYANLQSADLQSADLQSANLQYADLQSANLPSPTMVLLANWSGKLSAQLTADLMEYDASCHPDRDAFTKWANGGDCPYASVHVQRAANFKEIKELWGTGKPCGAYSLMLRLFSEKEIKVGSSSGTYGSTARSCDTKTI